MSDAVRKEAEKRYKIGFGFKIKAGPGFKPQATDWLSRIGNLAPTQILRPKALLKHFLLVVMSVAD